MSFPYAARVAAIKALLETLPRPGVIHDRSRWTVSWGQFLTLFKDPEDGRIRGWEITREDGTGELNPDWRETWVIRRYLGFNDQERTALLFQDDLDAAVRLFRDTPAFDFGVGVEGTVRIRFAHEVMLGDVLVHHAELELVTATEIDLL